MHNKIVLVTGGSKGIGLAAMYSAAKRALEGLTRSIALEAIKQGE